MTRTLGAKATMMRMRRKRDERACGHRGSGACPPHPLAWALDPPPQHSHASEADSEEPTGRGLRCGVMPSGWGKGRQGPWHSAHPQFSPWQ